MWHCLPLTGLPPAGVPSELGVSRAQLLTALRGHCHSEPLQCVGGSHHLLICHQSRNALLPCCPVSFCLLSPQSPLPVPRLGQDGSEEVVTQQVVRVVLVICWSWGLSLSTKCLQSTWGRAHAPPCRQGTETKFTNTQSLSENSEQ